MDDAMAEIDELYDQAIVIEGGAEIDEYGELL